MELYKRLSFHSYDRHVLKAVKDTFCKYPLAMFVLDKNHISCKGIFPNSILLRVMGVNMTVNRKHKRTTDYTLKEKNIN